MHFHPCILFISSVNVQNANLLVLIFVCVAKCTSYVCCKIIITVIIILILCPALCYFNNIHGHMFEQQY